MMPAPDQSQKTNLDGAFRMLFWLSMFIGILFTLVIVVAICGYLVVGSSPVIKDAAQVARHSIFSSFMAASAFGIARRAYQHKGGVTSWVSLSLHLMPALGLLIFPFAQVMTHDESLSAAVLTALVFSVYR